MMDTITKVNEQVVWVDFQRLSAKFLQKIILGDIKDYGVINAESLTDVFNNLWEDYSGLN